MPSAIGTRSHPPSVGSQVATLHASEVHALAATNRHSPASGHVAFSQGSVRTATVCVKPGADSTVPKAKAPPSGWATSAVGARVGSPSK